jgi:PadR family transcriptional regulator PadR
MERRGWIEAEWGLSESKRKAQYYELTAPGREQLGTKAKSWAKLVGAIGGVMGTRAAEA